MSLSPYLVLARFHLAQLGAEKIRDFADWQTYEDNVPDGNYTVFFELALKRAREAGAGTLAERLPVYDQNIRGYEERLAARRKEFRGFKYFQYLSLLFTEHHLDRATSDPKAYVEDLNNFLERMRSQMELPTPKQFQGFTLEDLRRLAFYLATGAGKTLLLHVHYWQVDHYQKAGNSEGLAPKGRFDNILLLAPNEGLAQQHLDELRKSGIPARILTEVKDRPGDVLPGTVLVVDMPKLRSERAKDPTEAVGIYYPDLGRANLVFADEGHKGTSVGGAWKRVREELAEEGLLLEYSATFAQVLSKPKQKAEYGKRILADYQYRYFYLDGYGKDFLPINVDPGAVASAEEIEDHLLLGGLLLFNKQLALFERESRRLEEFGIKRPLWIFVGHTVVKESKKKLGLVEEDEATLSDVAKVVRFLKRFLEDKAWAKNAIEEAVSSPDFLGHLDKGVNPFSELLQEYQGRDPENVYAEIANRVFKGEGALRMQVLPARGEIALRTSESGHYFGLIHIGDTAKFKAALEKQGFSPETNPLFVEEEEEGKLNARSLFAEINRPGTSVDLLIGSRRFIEGWSTWRVSIMTLLNMGRGEGPQVIQLFGRGVRLLGREQSLKRSGQEWIRPLETLYILGLRADYMKVFLNTISREEVLEEEISFPLKVEEPAFKNLPYVESKGGSLNSLICFEADKAYKPKVDLGIRLLLRDSENTAKVIESEKATLSEKELGVIRWSRLLRQLRAFAYREGYTDLYLDPEEVQRVLKQGLYDLRAEPLKTPEAIENAALYILRSYLKKFYRKKVQEHQSHNMQPAEFGPYIQTAPTNIRVRVRRDEKELVKKLRKLRKNIALWHQSAVSPLPRLFLDPNLLSVLAQPFVYKKGLPKDVHVQPTPLEESERVFLETLKRFWEEHREREPFKDLRLYLMRNASRAGLGFHHRTGFYPDFILWVNRPQGWRIVFVEPHGMRNESLEDNPKIEVLTQLLPSLNRRREFKSSKLELDGYILTNTPAKDIWGAEKYLDKWEDLANTFKVLVSERGSENNLRKIILG